MKALFSYAAAILQLPLSGTVMAGPAPSHCRCRPHEPCWPSTHKWQAFNESISGNLVAVDPVGSVCHDPTFDKAACANVMGMKTDSLWRSSQPGAVQYSNWESWPEKREACYIDAPRNQTCGQGRISRYSAVVHEPCHIQSAVRFAGRHNLRLVVKNTGHDFLGRSTAPESLQILTHFMKDITFSDNFVPEGARGGRGRGSAVTVGAGVQLSEIYRAAAKEKKVPVVGFAHTVGAAGGYIQGGGHSPLGPWKGMASDNVLEFKVVTAKGDFITANDYQHRDLFWALRGGGGGTFGVVTSVTMKTFTDEPITVAGVNFTLPASANGSYWRAVEEFHAATPALSDAGGSGYYWAVPNIELEGYPLATFTALFFFASGNETAKVDKEFKPLLSSFRKIPGIIAEYRSFPAPSFAAGLNEMLGDESSDVTGGMTTLGSRLLSRKLLSNKRGLARLTDSISKIRYNPGAQLLGHIVGGGQVARNKHLDTALNPAWRKALVHVVIPRGWDANATFAEQRAIQSNLTNVEVPLLKRLEPDMGAYQNEADPYEPHFQRSFWGSNYGSLYMLKKKWDPKGLFIVRSGVGSEHWDEEGLCRVR